MKVRLQRMGVEVIPNVERSQAEYQRPEPEDREEGSPLCVLPGGRDLPLPRGGVGRGRFFPVSGLRSSGFYFRVWPVSILSWALSSMSSPPPGLGMVALTRTL